MSPKYVIICGDVPLGVRRDRFPEEPEYFRASDLISDRMSGRKAFDYPVAEDKFRIFIE